MLAILLLISLASHLPAQPVPDGQPVYLDDEQPVEKRVQDLISRLTLEEKAILLNHRGPEIARFGIKAYGWNQCLHGERAGDEVVRLYIHDQESSVKRPTKELRGFHQTELNPGEKKTVTFVIPAEKLSFYNEQTHQFEVEPGFFDIMIGSSSEDIREKGILTIKHN